MSGQGGKNEGDLERTERVATPENVSMLFSEYFEILTNYTTYIKGADKMTQQVRELTLVLLTHTSFLESTRWKKEGEKGLLPLSSDLSAYAIPPYPQHTETQTKLWFFPFLCYAVIFKNV